MEQTHTNRTLMTSLGLVLVGIIVGVAAASVFRPETRSPGMHRMPDGTMMMNDGTHAQSMQGMMMDMSANLRDKSGAEFDQEFLREMIVHHQGAVDMAALVLEKSQQPKLRSFAEAIIAAQSTEIGQMNAWLETGF
jgi:uncharacterized protein (DUF305 family)